MDEKVATRLPRPGILGRGIRLALGIWLATLVVSLFGDLRGMVTGDIPFHSASWWAIPLALVVLSSWVLNELAQRRWGQRPAMVLVAGAALAAAAAWVVDGTLSSPWLGSYLWAWAVGFSALLGSAHLLAFALGTPGCEMRSFAHLRAIFQRRDVQSVACPGWIDRADGMRIMGRW